MPNITVEPENDPFSECEEFREMIECWRLPMTLMGGTRAMQAAGKTFLPQEDAEQDQTYANRLKRTFLYNGYRRAVLNLVGRVFAKEIQLVDTPENLEYLVEDADRQGHHLNVFARNLFKSGVHLGKGHILIDMPRKLPQGATLEDERAARQQPYFVHIRPEQVIGWRHEMRGGALRLTMVRFIEEVKVKKGAFGSGLQTRVKVIEENQWSLYTKNEKGELILLDQGPNTLGLVPFVTYYTNYKCPMVAEPPLEDLAYMNLAHWQSSSDQRQILHFARVPILFAAGIERTNSTQPQQQTISPDTMLRGPIGSTLTFVEHSGQAIGAGQQDLEALEDKMAVMGMEPMSPRSSNPTATGRLIDAVEITSLLQQWAIALGDALEQAFGFAAMWLNMDSEFVPSVKVNTDLSYSMRDAADLQTLLQARLNGEITRNTFLQEMKRRGVLSEAVDIEDELDRIEEQGPTVPEGFNPSGLPNPANDNDSEDDGSEGGMS